VASVGVGPPAKKSTSPCGALSSSKQIPKVIAASTAAFALPDEHRFLVLG
jgi:hypothetical protein